MDEERPAYPGLMAALVAGVERAVPLFEAAYDEHARRGAKLYEWVGD